VLSALVVHNGSVASAEGLADALWGSHPPVSWPKVVPGCVNRLRKAVGGLVRSPLDLAEGDRVALLSVASPCPGPEHAVSASREPTSRYLMFTVSPVA
jgi:hypothetical protein